MRKKVMLFALLGLLWQSASAETNYGLPAEIKDGNILHCFSWPIKYVREELPNIAAAGFGAVQLSPLQRSDIKEGQVWYDVYRPHDFRFIESEMGSAADLKALCEEASVYGIKIIVDVVNNHIDGGSATHDKWWDVGERQRPNPGKINYDSRESITHDALGDYGDVNSELVDVQNRAKAYIEELKSYGVKGIRFDAAKHIGLPSEGCNFWSVVTSVSDMWYYGEILSKPGPDASLITEYAKYISVTDDNYCNLAAQSNGGIPQSYAGEWDAKYNLGGKLVYWGESHDTYCNDGAWSKNIDQSVIDRAYCAFACRNNAAALYLSRPLGSKVNNEIKIGKGSTAFTSLHVAQVNKFRNLMVGRRDYLTKDGDVVSVTRENGGAVIVMKTSGYVSIANGGGFCPVGTYTDRVSGNQFTVTATTISGTVGPSGVAVIYGDTLGDIPEPEYVTITGDYNLVYTGDKENVYYWGGSSKPDWPGVKMTVVTGSDGKSYKVAKVAAETTNIVFNTDGDTNKTRDLYYCDEYVMTDRGADTMLIVNFEKPEDPDPDPDPDPVPGMPDTLYVLGNLPGHKWTTDYGIQMTKSGNTFVAENVTLMAASGDTNSYFNLSEGLGSDWDTLNGNYNRYGAIDKDTALSDDVAAEMKKYGKGDSAASCESWSVPAGIYNITANFSDMTVKVTKVGEAPEPEPDPYENIYYCYFIKPSDWSGPVKVWAWNDGGYCTVESEWPGDDMTEVGNKLYWRAPEGKIPTSIIFSNNGSSQTGDLTFVKGATYTSSGTHSGGEDASYPDKLYMIWDFNDDGWKRHCELKKTESGNLYIANSVNINFTGDLRCVNFADNFDSSWESWDDLNDLNKGATRYGAPADVELEVDSPGLVEKFAGGNAVNCKSWKVAEAPTMWWWIFTI